MKIFPIGDVWVGAAPPSVNLGPPHISESIIARTLKFYTHFASAFLSFPVCIPLPRLLSWRIYGDPIVAPSFPVFSCCAILIQASHAHSHYKVSRFSEANVYRVSIIIHRILYLISKCLIPRFVPILVIICEAVQLAE